jgi:hypothetical protein
MTIQTAVLVETLQALGAEVRWASLQHLLDARPCRGRAGRRRHARCSPTRARTLERLLGLHAPHLRIRRQGHARRRPQHDPGRRRRRHAADAPGRQGRERPRQSWPSPAAKKSAACSAAIKAKLASWTPPGTAVKAARHHRRDRGNHHRRAAVERDVSQGHAGRSAPSTSTTRLPRASSTTCTAAASPWWTPSSAPPT